jgi:hypothetical protein
MNSRENIIQKYEGQLLGSGSSSQNLGACYAKDLSQEPILLRFLSELNDGEAMITKAGVEFIEEYYDILELAKIIEEKMPGFPFDSDKNVAAWLEGLKNWPKQ